MLCPVLPTGDEGGTEMDTIQFHLNITQELPKTLQTPVSSATWACFHAVSVIGDVKIQRLHLIWNGKDHAKFSPNEEHSSKKLYIIALVRRISFLIAFLLDHERKVAKVLNSRLDICNREVLRYEELKNKVKLARVRDHFIFSVKSTAILPPDVLVGEVLMAKCRRFLDELDSAQLD